MDAVCLYCKGSGKFRHERPKVSDHFWLQMTAGIMRCPLCRGVGKLNRPVESPILDTGLIFCRTREDRILVGCPEPLCVKWIDCTEFFRVKGPRFEGRCELGHEMMIDRTPMSGGN